MVQQITKCKDSIKKIKKLLDDNGYNVLHVDDNILCKTPRKSILNRGVTNLSTTNATSCKLLISCGGNQSKLCGYNTCPYTGCSIPKKDCPLFNGFGGNEGSSDTPNTAYNSDDCLFRIMPTDIYNGIFLHVIFLHGEHCDLKMTFDIDSDSLKDIVNVINFLVG